MTRLAEYPGLFQAHVREARDEIRRKRAPVDSDGIRPFREYVEAQPPGDRRHLARRIDKMGEGAKYQLFTLLLRDLEGNCSP